MQAHLGTTSAHYYFSGASGDNADGELISGASCTITIDTTQSVLNGYALTIENSDGTTANAGDSSNDAQTDVRDSDATLSGNNAIISFTAGAAGENNHGFDFGFRSTPSYSLGDYVWYDQDQDGLQDGNEVGVNGITVELYNNGTCTGGAASSTTTANGGSSATDGFYSFVGLSAGTYSVQFSNLPTNTVATTANVGGDNTIDSDANTGTLCIENINLSADDPTQDLGIFASGTLGDLVWCESVTNANTTFDVGDGDFGIDGVAVSLYTDPNCDGDRTEGGLVTGLTNPVDTAGGGLYSFTGLEVKYVSDMTAANRTCYVTEVDTGDPALAAASCSTGLITTPYADELTSAAPTDNTNDFAFSADVAPSTFSLGDYVWYDTDRDGLQDGGEPGVADINVELYTSADCSGAVAATDSSDANGLYGFSGLSAGTYSVKFSGYPSDWVISPQDANSNSSDTIDSDADPTTGCIENITLGPDDFDEDIGLYVPGRIGSVVWCDDLVANNQYDPGEGLPGVTVELFADNNCDTLADGVAIDSQGHHR